MAEISNLGNGAGRKSRAMRTAIRIDMTPMVDLAFLLLTFFILTTAFNDRKIMELQMPDDKGPESKISDKNVFNVVLAENNKIYCWSGMDGEVSKSNYSHAGIRKELLVQLRKNRDVMVLIKPMDQSRYENIVDVIDEATITGLTRYAIVDFTQSDDLHLTQSKVYAQK